mmetsp:Transcript_37222/g.109872  ORF Transcript_37222/g.109872 Transcript_37222/m.109872 type:complete len:506 (+) Transcript_37222:2451-3968(+)
MYALTRARMRALPRVGAAGGVTRRGDHGRRRRPGSSRRLGCLADCRRRLRRTRSEGPRPEGLHARRLDRRAGSDQRRAAPLLPKSCVHGTHQNRSQRSRAGAERTWPPRRDSNSSNNPTMGTCFSAPAPQACTGCLQNQSQQPAPCSHAHPLAVKMRVHVQGADGTAADVATLTAASSSPTAEAATSTIPVAAPPAANAITEESDLWQQLAVQKLRALQQAPATSLLDKVGTTQERKLGCAAPWQGASLAMAMDVPHADDAWPDFTKELPRCEELPTDIDSIASVSSSVRVPTRACMDVQQLLQLERRRESWGLPTQQLTSELWLPGTGPSAGIRRATTTTCSDERPTSALCDVSHAHTGRQPSPSVQHLLRQLRKVHAGSLQPDARHMASWQKPALYDRERAAARSRQRDLQRLASRLRPASAALVLSHLETDRWQHSRRSSSSKAEQQQAGSPFSQASHSSMPVADLHASPSSPVCRSARCSLMLPDSPRSRALLRLPLSANS